MRMPLYNIQLLLQQCIQKSLFITLQKKYSKKLLAVLKWLIFQMSSFSKSSSFIVLPLRRKMAFSDSSTVVQVSCDSLKDNSMPSARFFPPFGEIFRVAIWQLPSSAAAEEEKRVNFVRLLSSGFLSVRSSVPTSAPDFPLHPSFPAFTFFCLCQIFLAQSSTKVSLNKKSLKSFLQKNSTKKRRNKKIKQIQQTLKYFLTKKQVKSCPGCFP